ncbi:unnamed protein product [Arctogadus glacialis]
MASVQHYYLIQEIYNKLVMIGFSRTLRGGGEPNTLKVCPSMEVEDERERWLVVRPDAGTDYVGYSMLSEEESDQGEIWAPSLIYLFRDQRT